MKSIYNKNTRFLVIDIETPKSPNHVIFDLSFGVYSQAEGKIGSIGYLVQENQNVIPYYADRLDRYAMYVDNGLYQVQPFAYIMAVMQKIIDKYDIAYATAYNSGFDFPRIRQACERANIACPLDSLVEFDLLFGACETLGQQKTFRKFVDSNELFTATGNRSSGAETMYRYLTLEPTFIEEHTGLADIDIEMQILDRVLRQKKRLSMKIGTHAWRLVQGA
jgi:hypothetical protein